MVVGGKVGMAVSVGGSVEVAVKVVVGVALGTVSLSGAKATAINPMQ